MRKCGGKNQFHQKKYSVRVASGFSLFLSLCGIRLSFFTLNIIGNLFFDFSHVNHFREFNVCGFCVYIRQASWCRKSQNILGRKNYFIYVHSMWSMNYLCTLLTTSSEGAHTKSLPPLKWEIFSSRFISLSQKKMYPPGK